ncbi:MAG: hypothetical protein LBK97_05795, partial [Prevotellaceae bacterium]|nr:hypothetical protein [Prevotellaceae bacterium]
MKTKLQKLEKKEKIDSRKFVEKELRNFVKKFPEFRVCYEFNKSLYLIEITPREIFLHSDDDMKYGIDMCDRLE